jgi:hypothetical protein
LANGRTVCSYGSLIGCMGQIAVEVFQEVVQKKERAMSIWPFLVRRRLECGWLTADSQRLPQPQQRRRAPWLKIPSSFTA